MKDARYEGFRPGRTGSSLLWDEGNRRDGDQPARRVRTRRGGEGCGGPLRLCRRERRGSGGSPLGARRKPVRLGPRRGRDQDSNHRLRLRGRESGRDHSRRGGSDRPALRAEVRLGDRPPRIRPPGRFLPFDARDRRRVRQWLAGSDWCYEDPEVNHDDHACERFASSLAWAYWPRPRHNIMAVHTAVTAAEFREMLPRLLGPDDESIASQGLPRRRSSPTLRQVS